MRRLTPFIVLVAFVFSCGGQWYVLQGIAWVTMIHDYAQMVPLATAVSMTLSGQYPCAICKAIAEKKQAQDDKLCSISKYDKKVAPALVSTFSPPEAKPISYPNFVSLIPDRTEAPPTPPPRLARA